VQKVDSLRELDVYEAFKRQQELFRISRQWPTVERYALTGPRVPFQMSNMEI
jgi:hypothetical protein